MAFSYLDKYSTTPADNSAAPPEGAPEGMTPGAVNNSMRQHMAALAEQRTSYLKTIANDPLIATSPEDPTSLPAQVFTMPDDKGNIALLGADQEFTGVNTFSGVGRAGATLALTDDNGADITLTHDGNTGTIGWDGTNQKFVIDSPWSRKWATSGNESMIIGQGGTEDTDEYSDIAVQQADGQNGMMVRSMKGSINGLQPIVTGAVDTDNAFTFDGTQWIVKTLGVAGDLGVTGTLTGTTADFTGALTGTTAAFTGALNGTNSTFSGTVNTQYLRSALNIASPTHYIMNDAMSATVGTVHHNTTNGLTLDDLTYNEHLYMAFDIGGIKQPAFFGSSSVALGRGFNGKNGMTGGWQTNVHNLFYSGAKTQLWMNASNLGNIDTTLSDERLKTIDVAAPALDTGAMIDAIETIQFTWDRDEDSTPQYGLSAQNLYTVNPLLAQGQPTDDVDESPMGYETGANIAMLIDEVKALRQRVKVLEEG